MVVAQTGIRARFREVETGYMGQLVDWPEVVSEGPAIESCRSMLQDALSEMILAYRQQGKDIPLREVECVDQA